MTELVHKSPCSVLVARGHARIPRRIIVGVDGSPESARRIRGRARPRDALRCTLPTDRRSWRQAVDIDLVRAITGEGVKETIHEPVRALVGASGIVDLVVVGSRGLHG